MTMPIVATQEPDIHYPDSDGKPIADNTLQFRWIVTIETNLEILYQNDANVFVAGDLFWYPVEGKPAIRTAPDTLVAFGRPKGYRGSYKQWLEGGIPPQVVFEIQSPNNTAAEMADMLEFYDRYKVDEYHLYDPARGKAFGWVRNKRGKLKRVKQMHGWTSPTLGIRFDLSGDELVIYHPDGERFLTFLEMYKRYEEAERRTERIENEKAKARYHRLAEQLRKLGIEPQA